MFSWTLALALIGQTPAPAPAPAPAVPGAPAARAKADPAAVADEKDVQGAAPAASARPDAKSEARSEIQKTIEQRKSRNAKEAQARAAKARRDAKALAERREYDLRMAPILAQQQQQQAQLQLQAQQAAAMRALGDAARSNAEINYRRYVLQTQRDGVPQMVLPDGSIVPYPYGIAQPRTYVGPPVTTAP